MPNDVSYFKLEGDSTEYAFNDLDAESRITLLAASLADEESRAALAEQANADAISAESDRAVAAETDLADDIAAETTRAETAETANTQALNDFISKVQVGQVTGITVPKNSSVRASVTYATPLDVVVPPIVALFSATTAVLGSCRVTVQAYDSTGFSVNIYNDDPAAARSPRLLWAVCPAASLQSGTAETTTLETTRSNLPIANGGTGASTAAAARENLGLDSVSVSVTTPTVSGVTVNTLRVYRVGMACHVYINFSLTSALSDWSTIATGLPIPAVAYFDTIPCWSSTFNRSCLIDVNTSGEANIRYGAATSYYASFSYPVA